MTTKTRRVRLTQTLIRTRNRFVNGIGGLEATLGTCICHSIREDLPSNELTAALYAESLIIYVASKRVSLRMVFSSFFSPLTFLLLLLAMGIKNFFHTFLLGGFGIGRVVYKMESG